jgi:hypothetical protein
LSEAVKSAITLFMREFMLPRTRDVERGKPRLPELERARNHSGAMTCPSDAHC